MFGGREAPIDIRKAQDNFDENRKPRCFNCNAYRYIMRDCRKQKKEEEMRKCYKCNKIGHLAKDCRSKQIMKIRRYQDEVDKSDKEENDKKKGFVEGSE